MKILRPLINICLNRITIITVSSLLIVTPAFAKMLPQMPPTLVTVATAKQVNWQPSLPETGTLLADQGITVKSEVDGLVIGIYADSGQIVNKGDLLFQLNPNIVNAEFKQGQAALTLKKMAYERARGLFLKRVVSEAEMDQATADYLSSKARVEQLQAQLDQLSIRAPFSGKLGLRKVSIGDYMRAGDSLVNLQSIDPINVDFSIAENQLKDVRIGEEVKVKTPAYPNKIFTGKVTAIESLIDPNTRTLKVRASLPNKEGLLIPGSFVEITLLTGDERSVILIPQMALVMDDAHDAVYVVKDNQATLTKVKVYKQLGKNVLVTAGLNNNDQVVIAGQIKLHDRAPVQILK